jgi:hypothetical protein
VIRPFLSTNHQLKGHLGNGVVMPMPPRERAPQARPDQPIMRNICQVVDASRLPRTGSGAVGRRGAVLVGGVVEYVA